MVPMISKRSGPKSLNRGFHGLGNQLLRHEYRRIDANILRSVVTENLDDLDKAVEALLNEPPD